MERNEILKRGERISILSSFVSFFLALIKGIVGFISGSVVLIADALESATDIASSFASFFGLKIAQKKPDEKFPYGYYKAESIASLFIGGLIVYAAINLLISSYERLISPTKTDYGFVAFAVVALSAVISLIISLYLKKKGNELNIQSLIASGKDRLKDFFVSIIIFVVILLKNIPYIEGILSIIISIIVLRIGVITAKDAIFALMDVCPSTETEKKIKKIIISINGVEDVKHIRLRAAGPFIFGDGHVKVKKFVDVERAHEVADRIEEKIQKNIKEVESFTIHIEPFKTEKQRIAIPIKNENGLESDVINHFGRAEKFIFIDVNKKNIDSYYFKKNPFKKKEIRAGLSAARFVLKENIDALITQEMGEISFHTLRDNLVEIYKTKGKKVKTVLKNFNEKKLEKLKIPTRRKE
ncbi:MAG: cation diffusion facilitator family transporter [Candidatus Nanoarchaeia archaeon]|nr:cation diffusion facilitator family transporter [Candidatus Nanoarchaeia archaeon]